MRSAVPFQANYCGRSGGRPTIPPSRTNAENSRRISQDSNDGEIGSDAGGVRAILAGGLEPRQAPPSHQFVGEGRLCIDQAALQDEASLYGGGQRFNFTVQAQRCERAGEALRERHPTAKTPLTSRKENRS